MSTSICSRTDSERGFSLLEVLISLMITLIVMGAVFTLLQRGHNSFRLEPEVADMNANARAGLSRITQDLTIAGYNTPAPTAIMWLNGGGAFGATGTPDELTIVYADPEIPWAYALPCSKQGGGGGGGKGKGGGGACKTIGRSATLFLVSDSLSPSPADPTKAYTDGMVLTALTMPNPDPASACGAVTPAVIPFELTGKPACSPVGEESKTYGKNCSSVRLNRNPGSGSAGINLPKGFNNDVNPDCAVIGVFHIVQYRINPLPPTANPMLERRDLADPDPVTRGLWVPVAANIENLQVQYSQGFGQLFDLWTSRACSSITTTPIPTSRRFWCRSSAEVRAPTCKARPPGCSRRRTPI